MPAVLQSPVAIRKREYIIHGIQQITTRIARGVFVRLIFAWVKLVFLLPLNLQIKCNTSE